MQPHVLTWLLCKGMASSVVQVSNRPHIQTKKNRFPARVEIDEETGRGLRTTEVRALDEVIPFVNVTVPNT